MYVFVEFLEVSWLPGRPGGPGEPSEVSGAPRVGFGTFWGDLGGSLGGVQSLLLRTKYVTNPKVLEIGRFSVTCEGLLILLIFVDVVFE